VKDFLLLLIIRGEFIDFLKPLGARKCSDTDYTENTAKAAICAGKDVSDVSESVYSVFILVIHPSRSVIAFPLIANGK
jgi:hypothetical protein